MAGLLVGVTAVLAASGVSLHWLMEQRLTAALDDALQANVLGLVPAIRDELRGPLGPRPPGRPQPPLSARDELTLQVRDGSGRSVLRSQHLTADLPRLAARLAPVPPGAPDRDRARLRFVEVAHPDRPGRWRAVALVLGPELSPGAGPPAARDGQPTRGPASGALPGRAPGASSGEPADARQRLGAGSDPLGETPGAAGLPTEPGLRPPHGAGTRRVDRRGLHAAPLEVVLLADAGPLQATLDSLAGLLLLTWLAGSAVAAGVVVVLLRQGLAPLERLQRQIESVRGPDDSVRFTLPDAPAELAPVVERLNALLERMAAGLRREQEFSGHAAHELRTPLAGLKATLELALSRPREADAYRDAASRSLAIVDELAGMVESLLLLAREDGGAPRACVLAESLELQRQVLAPVAAARRMSWQIDVGAAAVQIDPGLLAHLLRNLLDNALEHGDVGGVVAVEAAVEGHDVVLRVSNPCRAAPADLAERALEPFWRGDEARTDAARHAGLGLALCRRIAEHAGGALAVARVPAEVTVTLRLPGADPTGVAPAPGTRTIE